MRKFATAITAVLVVLAAACGIPEDDSARVIASGQEPFNPDPPPTTTTTLPEEQTEPVTFWLIDLSGVKKVRPVTREVARGSDGITLQKTIERLLTVSGAEEDPDDPDGQALFSSIPPGTTLAKPVVYREETNVAVVDLTGDVIVARKGSTDILREVSAQLVFTLSTLSLKDFADRGEIGLLLQIDGENVRVTAAQIGDGGANERDGAVQRSDYCPFDPDVEECVETAPTTSTSAAPRPTPTNGQSNNSQGNNPQGNNAQGNNAQGNNAQGNNAQGNNGRGGTTTTVAPRQNAGRTTTVPGQNNRSRTTTTRRGPGTTATP